MQRKVKREFIAGKFENKEMEKKVKCWKIMNTFFKTEKAQMWKQKCN